MWDLPWTDSEDLVLIRIAEELLKRGYGDPKVKFTIPMSWAKELDIHSNFRLQDPYGVDPAGTGEYGRYFYVESMTYNFMNSTVEIVGIDLQYILRQSMIVPHCGDVAETWMEASEYERMFAYVGSCTAGQFSDGEPLKKVSKCSE